MKKYTLKRGKLRAQIEDITVELAFRSPTTVEQLRYAPIKGRAQADLNDWLLALQPYADWEAAVEEYDRRVAAGEEVGARPDEPTSPVHQLVPEIWEEVAEAVSGLVAACVVIEGDERMEVDRGDRVELVERMIAPDLLKALTAALHAQDLTEKEKNS